MMNKFQYSIELQPFHIILQNEKKIDFSMSTKVIVTS